MRSTIIRNNLNFLKEVIHPDEIIFSMESCGCLTEDRVRFLNRLRNDKDKNHELLFMLQDFSPQKYSKFIRCLFLANQTPAALVLERGGEAVKVLFSNRKGTRTREFEMEFIETFQRMQTENSLKLSDLLNASVEKRLNDVCILHAKQNKGIELWFWCKTESSLNQLKCSSDEDIREIIQQMYKRLIPRNSASLVPQLIQMDYAFTSEFAERRLSIRYVGELEDRGRSFETEILHRPVSDLSKIVTSLADKIYAAFSNKILVYKNKYPYESLESIEIGDKGLPITIASCSINKCLYISSSGSRHVFKVEPEFDNRVSKWLDMDGTRVLIISVTSIGDVLVLDVFRYVNSGDNTLLMFTPEGTVKRAITLKFRFGEIKSMQEIMPDVAAVIYDLLFESGHIVIMRLDEDGTILRNIEWQQAIVDLSSIRYGDLLIGTIGCKDYSEYMSDHYDTGFGIVHLHHWTLESKAEQILLTTDERILSIHFAADRKQLYVLHCYRVDIYQLNYEDENCDT